MCKPKPVSYWLIIIPFYFSLFYFPKIEAQENLLLYPDLLYRVERAFLQKPGYHSPFHPQQISLLQQNALLDSIYAGNHHDLFYYSKNNNCLIINPVVQGTFETGSRFLEHYVAGLQLASEFSKFSLDINYTFHVITNHAFPETRIDSAGIIYHWGKSSQINNELLFFNSLNGKITYTPLRFLNLQLGNDKHFFGDGYRSLFLSDNAPAYPFFAITINLRKIRYTNMVAIMHDDTIGNYQTEHTKYTATHFLSWNVNRKLNFNIFETVVWRSRNDTLNHRGFDFNYLNPFIFYRPVEYNIGSPDNVLLGIGFHYMVSNKVMTYGQIMLDEFYYKEMLKGKEWWGNKNAFQIGVKWFDFLSIKDLFVQLEGNQARPYTYGHSYPLQNYGYMLQPLAHPLGTNFREALLILRYSKSNWFINSTFTFVRYGLEPGGKTVGADIYRSSNLFSKTYGNYIGQGITTNTFSQQINISRVLQPHWGLVAEAGISHSMMFLPDKQQQFFVNFGIKTLLYREEKLF